MINHTARDIITLFETSVCVETGIDFGKVETYKHIRKWFPDNKYYGVELSEHGFKSATIMKSDKNATVEISDSETFLKKYLNEFSTTNNPLFFLDAHSNNESPLKEEI